MVYALILSYRGDGYSGWQRQNNALTVQQVVEEALSGLLGSEVKIHGASRTDAGVHARGQVAHLISIMNSRFAVCSTVRINACPMTYG